MTGRKRDNEDLAGEIRELFADMWQVPRFSAGLRQGYRPQADCFRTDDPPALNVIVELPGVDPASVEVSVAGHALTVSGERTRPRTPGAHYLAMEIEYGPFERRIELGDEVDPTNVTAAYDQGMLRVVLPLARRSPQGKVSIEVRRA
ncbi:MAG TPA: Hsp20/alpha crystallin family protein [Gaiellaceae bacterium]|nr:Hsp20/alpha crystallin family protein [Gaiellaceae bacterium]